MKIAIIGTRGIPAAYGGFETFAEELSWNLFKRGHFVTVYGRRGFFEPHTAEREYNGVKLRVLPTIRHKYLETPINAIFCMIDAAFRDYDAILVCNAANSPFCWILKLAGKKFTINVDGIERMRGKWNRLGKAWYRLGEKCAVKLADILVSDARVIAEYYQKEYSIESEVIAYGAKATFRDAGPILGELKLHPKRYILYVSRLEPENNALGVIQAYNMLPVEARKRFPLVIVGDAPYADSYKAQLRAEAEAEVIFAGFRFGEAYQELQSHCLIYIQATEVGGTHPALVEAMAYGNCVIANGTPENIEVLGDVGLFYEKNNFKELSQILNSLLDTQEPIAKYGAMARQRAEKHYSWQEVTARYELLFERLERRK